MAAAPSLVWVALAGLVTLVAVKLYQRDQRLAQFPGPLLARFSDFWQLWFMYKDRPNEPYRQLHERYGKVVRMAPNKLYFSDPAAIRDIYGLRKDLRKVCDCISMACKNLQWPSFITPKWLAQVLYLSCFVSQGNQQR